MATVTDQSVIDFFTKDLSKEQRKVGDTGEVPERFRQNYFRMSICGEMWVLPNPIFLSKLSARVHMKKPGEKDFEVVMMTETVQGESSPNFVTRLDFEPLIMENSQTYAADTAVRIEGLLNGKPFCSVIFKLADLLWEQKIDAPIHAASILGKGFRRTPARGCIHINVTDARKTLQPIDFHQLQMTFQIAPSLWKIIPERKILLAVSTGAAKGRWSRLFLTEVLCRPFNNLSSSTFKTIYLCRGDLTCYELNHPVRVELFGYRRGHHRPLGFCQFTLANLASRELLPWTRVSKSNVTLNLRIRQWVTEIALSRITFTISAQRNRSPGSMRPPLPRFASGTSLGNLGDRLYGRATPGMPRAMNRPIGNNSSFRSEEKFSSSSMSENTGDKFASGGLEVVRFPDEATDIVEKMCELQL